MGVRVKNTNFGYANVLAHEEMFNAISIDGFITPETDPQNAEAPEITKITASAWWTDDTYWVQFAPHVKDMTFENFCLEVQEYNGKDHIHFETTFPPNCQIYDAFVTVVLTIHYKDWATGGQLKTHTFTHLYFPTCRDERSSTIPLLEYQPSLPEENQIIQVDYPNTFATIATLDVEKWDWEFYSDNDPTPFYTARTFWNDDMPTSYYDNFDRNEKANALQDLILPIKRDATSMKWRVRAWNRHNGWTSWSPFRQHQIQYSAISPTYLTINGSQQFRVDNVEAESTLQIGGYICISSGFWG